MITLKHIKNSIIWVVLVTFIFNSLISQPVQADTLNLPTPGSLISLTPTFSPSIVRGLKVYKDNPFKFDFIISQGDNLSNLNSTVKQALIKKEAQKLIKYFLASLTVPKSDMWVNLSPFERNRIVPGEFGITEMGKELLAQDYLLKQITSSLMYPEGPVGREFWKEIYAQAYKKLGTTNISLNTFNKVWIVPQTALVYENAKDNTAFILSSKLKVMLEEDYLASKKSFKMLPANNSNSVKILSNQLIREVIIPILDKEVNTGKNFAELRQVYNSLILALWYKNKLKETLISKGYVDRNKIYGVDVKDKNVDQKIFNLYLKSYKKGVYNYIKEDTTPLNESVERKYFSGGCSFENTPVIIDKNKNSAQIIKKLLRSLKPIIFTLALSAELLTSLASAAQPMISAGAQISQQYAIQHALQQTLSGSAHESNTCKLITQVISNASNGSIQLGPAGVSELIQNGAVRINGQVVTNINQPLPVGSNTVDLDLASLRPHENSPAPRAAVPTAPNYIFNIPVNPGDSISSIFAKSQSIQAALDPSKNPNIQKLIASGSVSIIGRDGTPRNTNYNSIYPGEHISFNLSNFVRNGGPISGPQAVIDLTAANTPLRPSGGSGGGEPPHAQLDPLRGGPRLTPAVTPTPPYTLPPLPQLLSTLPPQLSQTINFSGLDTGGPLNNQDLTTLSQTQRGALSSARLVLESLIKGVINYHGTEIRIRMGNTATDNFNSILEALYLSDHKIPAIIASIDPHNLNAPQLRIESESQFKHFLYSRDTVTIAKALPLNGEPLDLASIKDDKKFPPISPADVFKFEKEGRPFITLVQYKDDAGVQHEGILWAGEEAAQIKHNLMESALHNLKMEQMIVRILNIYNPDEQRRELAKPEYAELLQGTKIPPTGLLTTARIIPDKWDNIGSVDRFMVEGEIDYHTVNAPFPRAALQIKKPDGTFTELEYINSLKGVWMQFAEVSPEKAALLADPVHGSQYLNQFYPETMEQALQKPRYMFGPNKIREQIAESQFAKYSAQMESEAVGKNLELTKMRRNLSIVLDAVSLTMGAFGVPGGGVVEGLGNVAFDLTHNVKDVLPGPIAEERKDEILGWWLYSDANKSVHLTFEEYLANSESYKDWTTKGHVFRTSVFSPEQIAKADYFYRSRMDEALVGKFLGVAAEAGSLVGQALALDTKNVLDGVLHPYTVMSPSFSVVKIPAGQTTGTVIAQGPNVAHTDYREWIITEPRLKGLVNVLTQPIISWDLSSINLTQSAAFAITGKTLNYTSIHDMIKYGFKPSQLLPYFGFSLDTHSLGNWLRGDPLNPMFDNAPMNLRINIALPLLPLSLNWQIDNLQNQLNLLNDDSIGGIVVVDELFKSHSYGYTPEDLEKLSVVPGEAKIVLATMSDGRREIKVPVYVKYDQVTGKKTVIILKANMIQRTINDLEKKLQTYNDFERTAQIGGTSTQVSADSGTYAQNWPRHLFAANDQGGPIFNPLGMSNQQLEMALRAIKSHTPADMDKARDLIKFFYDHLRANTKLGESYAGAPESMNVETGVVAQKLSHEATALFGISLIRFHQAYPNEKINPQDPLSADQQVQEALRMIHDRLKEDSYKGLIENGDVAYTMFAFFDQYGDTQTANYILQGAVNHLWDPTARLLRYRSAEPGFASRTTIGWMNVLGPQRFAAAFLGGADKTDELIYVTRSIYHTFGEENGQRLKLLDVADNILRPQERKAVGFVAPTSDFVGILKQIMTAQLQTPLSASYTQELQDGINYYTGNLRSMENRGPSPSIPEATKGGVRSGVDFFSAIGKKSLGAYIEYETNVLHDANLLAPSRNQVSLPALPNVDQVPSDKIGVTKVDPADQKARDQLQRHLISLAQQQKALLARGGTPPPNEDFVEFIDPTNAQQIVTNRNGVVTNTVLIPSQKEVEEYVALVNRQLENARDYGKALRAEQGFETGAWIIHKVGPNNTVGDAVRINGHEIIGGNTEDLMSQVEAQTSLDRHQIDQGKYTNFTIDLNWHGLKGKYVLSRVFPVHKEIITTSTNPDSLERTVKVYKDGMELMSLDAHGITVTEHNDLRVATISRTYANTLDYPKILANPREYISQIRQMIAANQLPLDIITFTTDFRDKKVTNDQEELTRTVSIDLRNGEVTANTFSVHPQPIKVVNRYFVTDNHYNPYGRPQGSVVRDNAKDFVGSLSDQELLNKILNPISDGLPRFENSTPVQNNERTLARFNGQLPTLHKDLVHHTEETIITDGQGRNIGGSYQDVVNTESGTPTTLNYATKNIFDPNFFGGRVPVLSLKINTATGKIVQITQTIDFNPITQVSVVREINTRNGEIKIKTIEPQFGQVAKEEGTDSLGRSHVSTNQYTFDQLHISSAESIGGLTANTTEGDYDTDKRQWNLQQSRWNYHDNHERFLQRTDGLHLTARGHLVFQDINYTQHDYTLNGIHYHRDNRRIIPEYDTSDNISKISKGIVVDGIYRPKSFTEFSDYGDSFRAQNSLETLIVNGQNIPATRGHLLTSDADYWRTGRSSVELTSLIFENDKHVETSTREGYVTGKTIQAKDDDGNVVGELTTEFDTHHFDVQNRPLVATTFVHQNGHNVTFSDSTDATSRQEAELGLARTQINGLMNGLQEQELQDDDGLVLESDVGTIDATTQQFTAQRITAKYNFNDFRIADNSNTRSLLNGSWVPYTHSSLYTPGGMSKYDHIRFTGKIEFDVHNDFLSSTAHSIDWRVSENNRGNVVKLLKGHFDANGIFLVNREILSTFAGIPGLIGVADSTNTIWVVNGQELGIIDSSHLMTAHGQYIPPDKLNSVPAEDIFNSVHDIRYEGTRNFHVLGQDTTLFQTYQEIRNGLGNVLISLYGDKDAQGNFVSNLTEYRIYETEGLNKYGNFDIATSTIATIGTTGHEVTSSYSNNTHITNIDRKLVYRTQKGVGGGPPLTNDIFVNHKAFGQFLVHSGHVFILVHPIQTIEQIKDDEGRETITFSGFESIDPRTGFGTGKPTFVSTNNFDEDTISQDFARDSDTYLYDERMSEPNHPPNVITPLDSTDYITSFIAQHKPRVIAHLNDLRFETAPGIQPGVATYSSDDKREIGLRTRSLRLTGNEYRLHYEGSGVEGPRSFNLYLDPNNLPAYGTSLDEGKEDPYSMYRTALFSLDGKPYVLNQEFVRPQRNAQGQFHLDDETSNADILSSNGTILRIEGNSTVRTTPFSSVVKTDDLAGNSLVGKALSHVKRWVGLESAAEKALNYGQNHMGESQVTTYVDSMNDNANFYKEPWYYRFGEILLQVGILVGGMFALTVGMFILRIAGYAWFGLRNKKKKNANDSSIKDFESMGFTDDQSSIIVDERIKNGSFINFDDFKNRLEKTLLKDTHKLSENALKRFLAERRFKGAFNRISSFQFNVGNDAFTELNYNQLAGSTSVKSFMERIKIVYDLGADQEASFNSAVRMFDKYLTTSQLRAIIASQHFKSLINTYTKKRAVEVILKLMFEEIRDHEEYKDAVRKRVDDIITDTGLDKEFSDEINALKDTFLKNLELARMLPEGLQFHNFDIETDLLAYSWDDLRKGPDMDRQITSNLISIEKLFIFQVVFQRALYSLAGQGRAEEYLWAKYIYPRIHDRQALKDGDILNKIKAFRQVFHSLLQDEVYKRLEANRDPKGNVPYFQFIINEEIYNDAFRYLLGQKDPTLKDASWILPEKVKNEVAPLREKFEQTLESINTVIDLPEDQRRDRVKEIANELKPIIKAFVSSVDEKIGMPIIKGRLRYWKLTIVPLAKMVFDGDMRKRIFSKGGPYNQTAKDMVRRLNHYAIFGITSALFAYLAINLIGLLPFMALPYFIAPSWSIVAPFAASIISMFTGHFIKKRINKSFEKSSKSSNESVKKSAMKRFQQKIKILYSSQAILFLGALIITPLLGLTAPIFMIPATVMWAVHIIPILIFIETWRLTFFAMNYLLNAMAVRNDYMINNTYEVTKKDTKKIVGRLMSLFTDSRTATGSLFKTKGQETLDSFINHIDETTSDNDGYFMAENIASDGRSKLTDVLEDIAAHLTDSRGQLNPQMAQRLKKEIEWFVSEVQKPITMMDDQGNTYTHRKFKSEWLNKISLFFVDEERQSIQKVIDFINTNYRLDKGPSPRSWDQVIPLTIAFHGHTEDWYYTNGELLDIIRGNIRKSSFDKVLNGHLMLQRLLEEKILLQDEDYSEEVKLNPEHPIKEDEIKKIALETNVDFNKIGPMLEAALAAANESQEFTHRLGMLAKYKKEPFLYMVRRLTKANSKERNELLKMMDNPAYRPSDIESWSIWPDITEWANLQLPTGYANAITHKRTMKLIYTHHAKIFQVKNYKEAAEEKIRIIDRNLMAVDALDKTFGGSNNNGKPENGRLRQMIDVLIETNYQSTYKTDSDKNIIGVKNPYELIDQIAPKEGKYDRIMQRKLLDMIIIDRVFPVRLFGGLVNTDPLKTENYNRSKWNQKTSILPFLIGPVLLNLDVDHRASYVDMEFIPNHLLEYQYLPGLATSTPIIKHTLTKGLGLFGNILPVSENAFYYHAQQGKELFGGLTAYGKLFERVSALRHSEGITDSYVAEDAVTALNYRRFGYITGRAGYIKSEKGWPFSFAASTNPVRKWSYDSIESVTGRAALKIYTSPLVDWPYLINNFWLDGFGFYFKKPAITRYIRWLLVISLIFDWNPFNNVKLFMWIGGLVFSQSISHGLFSYKMKDESRGFFRGGLSAILHIIVEMYTYFVHMVFVYDETVSKLALMRLGKFILTASKGSNQTRMMNKEVYYLRSNPAIKAASILALATIAYVGISLTKAVLWAPTLLMGFAGVAAPFVLNPVRHHQKTSDRLDNTKDIFKAFWWGLQDNIENFRYAFEKAIMKPLPLSIKSDDDLQLTVLNMVDSYLPMPFDKIPANERGAVFEKAFGKEKKDAILELTEHIYLFHQKPNHYRAMYGRPSLQAIFKLLSYLIEHKATNEDTAIDNNTALATAVNTLGLAQYRKDVLERYNDILKTLENLKLIEDYKETVTNLENNELVAIKKTVEDPNSSFDKLKEANRVINEISWLPKKIKARNDLGKAIAQKTFGFMGVAGGIQAFVFYALFPVLLLSDKIFFGKKIKSDLVKSMSNPSSTKPIFGPAFAGVNASMISVIKASFDDPNKQIISRAMGTVIPKQADTGGIDFSQTSVNVASSGELIHQTFSDPSILCLLLNSDGLTPIIKDMKNMSSYQIDHFVGVN